MSHISIGVSAFRAAQAGLTVTGQNLANAATKGYHKQRVDFSERPLRVGEFGNVSGGVQIDGITRLRDAAVEQSISTQISGRSAAESRLQYLQRLERTLTPSEYSVHKRLNDFFDNVEQLAADPSDTVLRQQFLNAAEETATAVREIDSEFQAFRADIRRDVQETVDRVNQIAEKISELNREIRVAQATTSRDEPTSQLNERDRLVGDLAELVDVDPRSLLRGADPLVAAGGGILVGETASTLTVDFDANGSILLSSSAGLRGLDVRGGRLGGLLDTYYSSDLEIMGQFQDWAQNLLREIDHVQTTGISLDGPPQALIGHRRVMDATLPLQNADTFYPVQSGEITVTMTDPAGQRTSTVISVDTSVDSLSDVVGRLDAVSGLSATYDAASGQTSIHADAGYSFDFAGRIDPQPASAALTGTSVPTFGGQFTGSRNTAWNITALNDGDVGVTQPLLLRVTDAVSGEIIGDVNVGQGYAVGDPVELGQGVTLNLSQGNLKSGDTFSVTLTADGDETRLLAALGLQTVFQGDALSDVKVDPQLARNPDGVAASQSGLPGDNRQINRLAELRSEQSALFGGETAEERLSSLTGLAGTLVASLDREIGQRDTQLQELNGLRDSVSGVDPNEELLNLLEFQRAFQAAARFVTTMDETLDDLLGLIR